MHKSILSAFIIAFCILEVFSFAENYKDSKLHDSVEFMNIISDIDKDIYYNTSSKSDFVKRQLFNINDYSDEEAQYLFENIDIDSINQENYEKKINSLFTPSPSFFNDYITSHKLSVPISFLENTESVVFIIGEDFDFSFKLAESHPESIFIVFTNKGNDSYEDKRNNMYNHYYSLHNHFFSTQIITSSSLSDLMNRIPKDINISFVILDYYLLTNVFNQNSEIFIMHNEVEEMIASMLTLSNHVYLSILPNKSYFKIWDSSKNLCENAVILNDGIMLNKVTTAYWYDCSMTNGIHTSINDYSYIDLWKENQLIFLQDAMLSDQKETNIKIKSDKKISNQNQDESVTKSSSSLRERNGDDMDIESDSIEDSSTDSDTSEVIQLDESTESSSKDMETSDEMEKESSKESQKNSIESKESQKNSIESKESTHTRVNSIHLRTQDKGKSNMSIDETEPSSNKRRLQDHNVSYYYYAETLQYNHKESKMVLPISFLFSLSMSILEKTSIFYTVSQHIPENKLPPNAYKYFPTNFYITSYGFVYSTVPLYYNSTPFQDLTTFSEYELTIEEVQTQLETSNIYKDGIIPISMLNRKRKLRSVSTNELYTRSNAFLINKIDDSKINDSNQYTSLFKFNFDTISKGPLKSMYNSQKFLTKSFQNVLTSYLSIQTSKSILIYGRDTGILTTKLAQSFPQHVFYNVRPTDAHAEAHVSLNKMLYNNNIYTGTSFADSRLFEKISLQSKEAETYIYMQVMNMDVFLSLISETSLNKSIGEKFHNILYSSELTVFLLPSLVTLLSIFSHLITNPTELNTINDLFINYSNDDSYDRFFNDLLKNYNTGDVKITHSHVYTGCNFIYTFTYHHKDKSLTDGFPLSTLLQMGLSGIYIPDLVDQYLLLPMEFMIEKGITELPSNHIFIIRNHNIQTLIALSNYRLFTTQIKTEKTILKYLQKNIEKDRSTFSILLWEFGNSTLPLLLSERYPQATILYVNSNQNENLYIESITNSTSDYHQYKNIYLMNNNLSEYIISSIYNSPEFMRYQFLNISFKRFFSLSGAIRKQLLSISMTTFIALPSTRSISMAYTIFQDDIYNHCPLYLIDDLQDIHIHSERYLLVNHPRSLYTHIYPLINYDKNINDQKAALFHHSISKSNIHRYDILHVNRTVSHHFMSEKDGHQRKYIFNVQANFTFTNNYLHPINEEKLAVPPSYHMNNGVFTSVYLNLQDTTRIIPYNDIYGVTLIFLIRMGLTTYKKDYLYKQFLSLPLYVDMASWNILAQGNTVTYIDSDTQDNTFNQSIGDVYKILQVLVNYERTIKDFDKCNSEYKEAPFYFSYIGLCVKNKGFKLRCPTDEAPIPCSNNMCYPTYIQCLQAIGLNEQNMKIMDEESKKQYDFMKHGYLGATIENMKMIKEELLKQ